MPRTSPSTKSQTSRLSIGLVCVLICAALVGLSYLLNNTENAIYQSGMQPIPTGTPDDPNPNEPVTCNGVQMSLSDKCEHTLIIDGQKGPPTDYTYEQQKQYLKQLRLKNVVMQREKLDLQQHQRPKPFAGLLGCLSFPLFLVGACAGIATLLVFGQWFGQLFRRRHA